MISYQLDHSTHGSLQQAQAAGAVHGEGAENKGQKAKHVSHWLGTQEGSAQDQRYTPRFAESALVASGSVEGSSGCDGGRAKGYKSCRLVSAVDTDRALIRLRI